MEIKTGKCETGKERKKKNGKEELKVKSKESNEEIKKKDWKRRKKSQVLEI